MREPRNDDELAAARAGTPPRLRLGGRMLLSAAIVGAAYATSFVVVATLALFRVSDPAQEAASVVSFVAGVLLLATPISAAVHRWRVRRWEDRGKQLRSR